MAEERLPLSPREGFLAQLADPKFAASIVACVMLWLVYRDAKGDPGMTSADKRDALQNFMLAVAAIFSTTMAALGYQKGKLNEGTVAEGTVSTATPLLAHAATLQPLVQGESLREPGRRGPGSLPSLLWIAGLLTTALLFTGCASTSRTFQYTAKATVDHVGDEMRPYIAQQSDEATKAAHGKEMAELQATVEMPIKKIDAADVAKEWADVDPLLRQYISTDDTLAVGDREMILKTPEKFTATIRAELQRQNAIRQRLFLPPHPVP